jgi:arabinofuranan 3-O-arabinosyltransferase
MRAIGFWAQLRSRQAGHPKSRDGLVFAIAGGVVAGYVAAVVMVYTAHLWLLDPQGHPLPFDFVAFWAAGRQALGGAPLAAFDPYLQHAAEVATVGHEFGNILGWSYPPLFLLVATGLACLPYVPAFAAWMSTTLALYGWAVGAIAKRKFAWLVALTPPWVLIGIMNGQNGFLTAAVMGAALIALERRPALSGIVLGLMSYKPQLAILFPLALAAGGYWLVFGCAVAGTLAWTLVSCLAFGSQSLLAFLHALFGAAHTHLGAGGVIPENLQSLYGLARWFGASPSASGALQLGLSILCGICVVRLWSSATPFALKAAGLVAAVPLATPYIYVSDLSVLSVALAFLFRNRSFEKHEYPLLVAAGLAVAGYVLFHYPAGLLASGAIAGIVWRRWRTTQLGLAHSGKASAKVMVRLIGE